MYIIVDTGDAWVYKNKRYISHVSWVSFLVSPWNISARSHAELIKKQKGLSRPMVADLDTEGTFWR